MNISRFPVNAAISYPALIIGKEIVGKIPQMSMTRSYSVPISLKGDQVPLSPIVAKKGMSWIDLKPGQLVWRESKQADHFSCYLLIISVDRSWDEDIRITAFPFADNGHYAFKTARKMQVLSFLKSEIPSCFTLIERDEK